MTTSPNTTRTQTKPTIDLRRKGGNHSFADIPMQLFDSCRLNSPLLAVLASTRCSSSPALIVTAVRCTLGCTKLYHVTSRSFCRGAQGRSFCIRLGLSASSRLDAETYSVVDSNSFAPRELLRVSGTWIPPGIQAVNPTQSLEPCCVGWAGLSVSRAVLSHTSLSHKASFFALCNTSKGQWRCHAGGAGRGGA